MSDTVAEVVKRMEMLVNGDYVPCGISTGFPQLDELTGGLRAGSLFVVASPPSSGRSSFVRHVIEAVGLEQNLPLLAFTPGLDSLRWVERLIYAASGFSSLKMSQPLSLTKGELLRLQRVTIATQESGISVDDHSLRIEEICDKVREMQQETRLALVVVEDLPLLVNEDGLPGFHHPDDVAKVLCLLRGLAKELKIPVLVTCNQEVPLLGRRLEDTKIGDYSGFTNGELVSTHADQLAFLSRYHTRRFGPGGSVVEFDLVKNRGGRTGLVRMNLMEDIFLFGPDGAEEDGGSDSNGKAAARQSGES
jgi:replicative DNA helicase